MFMWAVGYVLNLSSDSWLLKGGLLLALLLGMALLVRFVAFSPCACLYLLQTPSKVPDAGVFSEVGFT